MKATINQIKKEAAKHGGKVEKDGNGEYDLLAPEGSLWAEAEVWCQPIPLGEEDLTPESKAEMLESALAVARGGVKGVALSWKETRDGDWEAAGFVIVRQCSYRKSFALYETFANSNQAQGNPWRIGSLEECQKCAEELR